MLIKLIKNLKQRFKKHLLNMVINDVKKDMPHLKDEALKLLEVYRNELWEFCKKKLKEAIEEFINYKFNKTV